MKKVLQNWMCKEIPKNGYVEEGMNKFIEKAFVHGKNITPYIGAVLSLLDIATDYVEEKIDESTGRLNGINLLNYIYI